MAKKSLPTTYFKLPPGWRQEALDTGEIVLCRPQRQVPAYVTVDFGRRVYDSGHGPVHRPHANSAYKGPNWEQRIVDDAIAWLESVFTKSARKPKPLRARRS